VRNANLRPLRVRRSNQSFENLAKATLSISVAFVFLLLAACGGQVRPEKTVVGATGNAEGQWRGKALVKDGRNGKSGTLDLDLIAKEPQALRIEAASSFGIPVASVAMSGGRIEVLLPQEKRFITSPADRGSLSRLIPVHISPDALLALLFERPLDRSNEWKCTRAGNEFTPFHDEDLRICTGLQMPCRLSSLLERTIISSISLS